MDNNTRCYEGIQRIYRNAVVRYLRTKMTAAFGQEALAKLREPFRREEWEAIEAAATSPRASGHLDAPVGDAFDLLSVNHFFNIFDKYWSTLMESAPDAALERTSRRSILDWMREIKGLRDPLSHPAEADFTREDSFRVLDCARRVLGRLDCQRETAEIGAIIRQCGLLVRGGRRDEAETLMNSALAERPGDSDLYGFSGWIYKNWTPVRLADARRQFARAAELKSIKEEMYEHWARLEMDQREWTRAAEAAEKGLELLGESAQLRYWAGRARGHLAKELLGGLHNDRAAEEARAARGHLEGALETVREEDKVGTYQIYRALVLLCEAERDVQGVGRFLRRWAQDGPMNDVFKFEKQRLEDKFRRSFG